jgi:bifunctional non-homologous end joining protein LigD
MVKTIKVDNHIIELSNISKVLFPDDGITKGDLIEYYHKIAEIMLPYLRDRPLVMYRYPDGINKDGIVQQKVLDYFPDWIESIRVKKAGGSVEHIVCQNTATLIYLANQACFPLHIWMSRRDLLDYPDQLIFDLDPSGKDFELVREVALILRKFLQNLNLEPLVKTTGSRGLHVALPLDRSANFNEVRTFARRVANIMAEREPEKITIEQRKQKRGERVLLDYVRNSYGQTVVAPYSVRARPGAPIATPLDWDDVSNQSIGPQSYSLKNIFERLDQKRDVWAGEWRKVYSLEKAIKKLNEINRSSTTSS